MEFLKDSWVENTKNGIDKYCIAVITKLKEEETMTKTIAKGIGAVYLPVSSPYKSSKWYVNGNKIDIWSGWPTIKPLSQANTDVSLV
jgi:hypothetical protein